jgi:hypothetical protein
LGKDPKIKSGQGRDPRLLLKLSKGLCLIASGARIAG